MHTDYVCCVGGKFNYSRLEFSKNLSINTFECPCGHPRAGKSSMQRSFTNYNLRQCNLVSTRFHDLAFASSGICMAQRRQMGKT